MNLDVIKELRKLNLKQKDLEKYKKFLKDYKDLSIKNKIELFFDDIVEYVNKQYAPDALQALDKIIIRFGKGDFEKAFKGYKNKAQLDIFGEIFYRKRIYTKNVKNAFKALGLNFDNYELNQLVELWLWNDNRKNENIQEAIKQALEGKDKLTLSAIKHFIATKYFEWYYDRMEFVINEVIESFENLDELKNKISEFTNKKELELKRLFSAMKRYIDDIREYQNFMSKHF